MSFKKSIDEPEYDEKAVLKHRNEACNIASLCRANYKQYSMGLTSHEIQSLGINNYWWKKEVIIYSVIIEMLVVVQCSADLDILDTEYK